MITESLPRKLKSCHLVSFGAVGLLSQINSAIAVKYLRQDLDDPEASQLFRTEQEVYKQLELRRLHHSALLRCFLMTENATFLEFIPGQTLWQRHFHRQIRDASTRRVERVTQHDSDHLISTWIYDLTHAISVLEQLNLVHGDLTDNNILISITDRLVLIDFDRVEKTATPSDGGGGVPFSRPFDLKEGFGPWGMNGWHTDQFTLGSILYCMSRGFQPYEDTHGEQDGPETIRLMRDKKFPKLDDSPIDQLIKKCWHYEFNELESLRAEIARSFQPMQNDIMSQEDYLLRCDESNALVNNGLLS